MKIVFHRLSAKLLFLYQAEQHFCHVCEIYNQTKSEHLFCLFMTFFLCSVGVKAVHWTEGKAFQIYILAGWCHQSWQKRYTKAVCSSNLMSGQGGESTRSSQSTWQERFAILICLLSGAWNGIKSQCSLCSNITLQDRKRNIVWWTERYIRTKARPVMAW